MSSSSSDRNVLFGVLALQMEFITQAGLIAALQAWTLQKSRLLGELLVELGHMSAEDRDALEPMVDRHVARHGGSAEQSLAAISSVSEIAAELRELNDADVQQSLQHVERQESRQAGSLSGVNADEDPPQIQPTMLETMQEEAQPAMRFQLLRPHAEGGLGKVWIARDRELNREVAFKEIKSKRAQDTNSRARFVLEAEITGGLEHPGIVPVYGLGHFADGRPFYAMRFIRGRSLKEAIEQFHKTIAERRANSLAFEGDRAFRNLIQRLIDVCNAIAYAHSRGVLHRDLKPGNIMLGKYGETLVVDWGLAKAKGQSFDPAASVSAESIDHEPMLSTTGSEDVASTQMGSAIGTPKFMSPEQAAGRLDLLGPPADVYSLGATLYELLTGQAPIGALPGGGSERLTIPEVLRRVEQGAFPAPRSVLPLVPAALEAVCLKAMSRDPQARYATAQALAEDLERWLAGDPVSVYREPLPVRVRRFVRRRQVAATSLAAALLVGLIGLGVLSAVVSGSNQRLKSANASERLAKTDAETKRAEAEAERNKAETALEERDSIEKQRVETQRQLDAALERAGRAEDLIAKVNPEDPQRQLLVAPALLRELEQATSDVDSEKRMALIAAFKTKKWLGVRSCFPCHTGGRPAANDPNFEAFLAIFPDASFRVLLDEAKTWSRHDQHSKAYFALTSKHGRSIGQLLGVDASKDQRCLSCHACDVPDQYRGDHKKEPKHESFRIEEGVNCDACHGPSSEWLQPHAVGDVWQKKSRKEKAALGMIDLSDPVGRTQLCLSCHLGSPAEGKVITHTMYAAGHPPLFPFELETFCNQMPRHWRRPKDLPPKIRESLPMDGGLIETKSVVLGGLVTLRESMALLSKQAYKGFHEEQWPDLAQFDCAACHTALEVPSWKRVRDSRSSKLGQPRLPQWPRVFGQLGGRWLPKDEQLPDILTRLDESISRGGGFGEPKAIVLDSRNVVTHLDRAIATLQATKFTPADAIALLKLLSALDADDYDSARILVQAFQSIYAELEPKPSKQKEIDSALVELQNNLRLDLRGGENESLELPTGGRVTLEYLPRTLEARHNYDPSRFKQQLQKLSQLLEPM